MNLGLLLNLTHQGEGRIAISPAGSIVFRSERNLEGLYKG
jgi:hypothetical protein